MKSNETKPEGKSRFAQKLARKHGRARPDPRWMWWMSAPGRPDGAAVFVPPPGWNL